MLTAYTAALSETDSDPSGPRHTARGAVHTWAASQGQPETIAHCALVPGSTNTQAGQLMFRKLRLPPIRPHRSPLYYPLFAVSAVLTLGVLYGCKDAVAGPQFAGVQAASQPGLIHAQLPGTAHRLSGPEEQQAATQLLSLN